MASKVDIANMALGLVGQATIVDLTDPTEAARQANKFINQAIQEVLRSGRWKSAQKPANLAQLATPPPFKWNYAYQLPNDYIRMVRYNDVDPLLVDLQPYDIAGNQLYSDDTTAGILYVCDLTADGNSVGVADPLLTELFALNLAVKLCWPFQQARTLRESLNQEYMVKRRTALATDAQETKRTLVNRLHDSEWLVRRRFSTNA